VVEETLDYVLRELALAGGGLASARTRTPTASRASRSLGAREGAPDELLERSRTAASSCAGRLDEASEHASSSREQRPKPLRDERRSLPLEPAAQDEAAVLERLEQLVRRALAGAPR